MSNLVSLPPPFIKKLTLLINGRLNGIISLAELNSPIKKQQQSPSPPLKKNNNSIEKQNSLDKTPMTPNEGVKSEKDFAMLEFLNIRANGCDVKLVFSEVFGAGSEEEGERFNEFIKKVQF